jgi:hypothetical protein
MIKMVDISERFDTPVARRLEHLRSIERPNSKLTDEFLQVCVGFSEEREKIFRKVLQIKKDDEPKRAEVMDFSLTLFRKFASLMGISMLNNFSDANGFFVYSPHKPRVIAVTPEGNKLTYWFIKGIRMRALDPRLAGRLMRVCKLPDHTAYLQPKVLDHEEYEHLIELLGRELEAEKNGGEVIKSGLPENYSNR